MEEGSFSLDSRLCLSYGYCDSSVCDSKTKSALLSAPQVFWDRFYASNKREFFKDRHWLLREFEVLSEAGLVVCELGCGVGNSTFPLLEANPSLQLFCFDFSSAAVALLRSHRLADRLLRCAVADCTLPEQVLQAGAPEGGCDAVLLVFVLSAMPVKSMAGVVATARAVLRKGGKVLVRDYGAGDAAQIRFEQTPGSRQLDEQLFCRGDGTQAFFFHVHMLKSLWEEGGHFVAEQCVERTAEPAAAGGHVRRFVQGIFVKQS